MDKPNSIIGAVDGKTEEFVVETGVVYRRNGKYLKCVDWATHAGMNYVVSWVYNLHDATVFSGPLPAPLRRQFGGSVEGAQMIRAAVTKAISLLN